MAVKFRDYYEAPGVARTASEDDVKKARRKVVADFDAASVDLRVRQKPAAGARGRAG